MRGGRKDAYGHALDRPSTQSRDPDPQLQPAPGAADSRRMPRAASPYAHLWWVYLALCAAATGLYAFAPPLEGSALLRDLLGVSGALAVLAGMRIHRPRSRTAWRCFAAGVALFAAGELYTSGYPQLTGSRLPFPSPADALSVAVDPVLMVGLLILVCSRNRRADRAGLIDALIISLGLALPPVTQLIAPAVQDASLALAPKLASIAHPAGGILLLVAAIRLAFDAGRRRAAFRLVIASLAALLVTGFLDDLLTREHLHHPLWLGSGFIAFSVLWGTAALHPTMDSLADAGAERAPRLTPGRLALLAGATLIAPALEYLSARPHHDPDLLFVIAASAVLFSLVAGRMAGLVHQRERAAARERSLGATGERLVGATSLVDIATAGLVAVPSLAGDAVRAFVCRLWCEEAQVARLDVSGELVAWGAPVGLADFLARTATGGPHRLPARIAEHLRLEEPDEVIVALGTQSDGQGWLLVTGERAPDIESRASLATLAHQISLAVERNRLSETAHRAASEQRLSSLVRHSSDLITLIDESATIVYQGPSIEAVLGYSAEQVIGRPFAELLHPSEQGRLPICLADGSWSAAAGEPMECVLAAADGSPRSFEVLLNDLRDDEHVRGIVLNGRDVSERKAFEEQLTHQAFHDSVTHLANRALFNERARHAVARARREPMGLAAIFIDLDDFKTINDSLGHAAGDEVLLEVAKRITLAIRSGDTPARFGGDEFAVLLEDVDGVQAAADTAERILDSLSAPLEIAHKTLSIRASLGISIAEAGAVTDADELIRNADAAMYIAKTEGKVADFRGALHDAGLEPGALTLEITESVMMTDTDLAAARLAELHALGVRLAMDDFGTGYSSLSTLSRFPLDVLKMDRSLLAAGAAPITTGLASAVLGLGDSFALEVVAEGIEYPEQSTTLRDLGCETGQGFFFARPMPPAALFEFLSTRLGERGSESAPATSPAP